MSKAADESISDFLEVNRGQGQVALCYSTWIDAFGFSPTSLCCVPESNPADSWARFGRPANRTGTQGKSGSLASIDNRASLAELPEHGLSFIETKVIYEQR
ncbi:hypothetical protein OC610_06905 [Pseudomonas sp. SAICEU22]|uniref:Uncharacterized protein n=1 Tax=Pseudomonas agronomica TaxID=2979328 RepID=A0ABT3F6L1_9PSED|nr:hypothetical protein [Pseudomonas agronomica]MCW1244130.1 hypothetical protein [Pseudomonas agronomica]